MIPALKPVESVNELVAGNLMTILYQVKIVSIRAKYPIIEHSPTSLMNVL